jgi:hypothetical protein
METASEDSRFSRHYRQILLGLRLLSHGARPQTASEWSRLSLDRLVTLKRRWLPDAGNGFRGPAPSSFDTFFRSTSSLAEATLFASIHYALLGHSRRRFILGSGRPNVEGGELLCEAYEIFLEWERNASLEFDQAVLLATGTLRSERISLTFCPKCGCAVLADKFARRPEHCSACRRRRIASRAHRHVADRGV